MELSCLLKSHVPNWLIGVECKYPLSSRLYGDSWLLSVALYVQACESISGTAERIGLTSVLEQMVGLRVYF
jgi:hypothetical protein